MADKEYIERGALIAEYDRVHVGAPGGARKLMVDAPTADVVSRGVYDQVKWERDVAMQQLEEHGIPFGGEADDVVKVRHGEWQIKSEIYQMLDDVDEEIYVECPFCQRTFWVSYEFEDEKILQYAREHYPYCNCGAKMDGERKEQT